MSFDGEMLRYCGRQARVLRRVDQIIDEKTGRMLRFKNPCIVLDDVVCTGATTASARAASTRTGGRCGWSGWSEQPPGQPALGRAPAVAAVNATRTGSHLGDTPSSCTSGSSNSRSTSRASARRPRRSRR
jgi:hypothetical protein